MYGGGVLGSVAGPAVATNRSAVPSSFGTRRTTTPAENAPTTSSSARSVFSFRVPSVARALDTAKSAWSSFVWRDSSLPTPESVAARSFVLGSSANVPTPPHEAPEHGVSCQFARSFEPQLRHDVALVRLHRLRTNEEQLRDFAVGYAVRNQI